MAMAVVMAAALGDPCFDVAEIHSLRAIDFLFLLRLRYCSLSLEVPCIKSGSWSTSIDMSMSLSSLWLLLGAARNMLERSLSCLLECHLKWEW